jgi:hypothetical protein
MSASYGTNITNHPESKKVVIEMLRVTRTGDSVQEVAWVENKQALLSYAL